MMMSKKADEKYINNVVLNGTREDKLALYLFNDSEDIKIIAKKFHFFVIGNFIRYYKSDPAQFHDEMIEHYIKSYLKDENFLNIGYRGCAKTTLKKLFDVFVLLNDESKTRRFFKVMTKDLKNSKQIVTDVYNLMVEVEWLYGDVFEKEGRKKREETMQAFTLKDGRRYAGGTVGQTQRGQIQDAYRPDWVWFEDIEDSATIRSMVQTQSIISKSDEAIQGMSDDGNFIVTANYISEEGTIEWFKGKKDIVTMITPIIDKKGNPTWKKTTLEKIEKIKADAEDWEGDYMCDPTSGKDKFFDIDLIKAKIEKATAPKQEIAFVKFWNKYFSHHKYGMGGDTAEGIGADSNALVLFDFTLGEVIGTYHSNEIAPDLFGYEMAKVGRLFGGCILAPERNNTGHATISALKEDEYPNVFIEEKTDEVTNETTRKLGWETNRKTRPKMWFDFKRDFEDGAIEIYDIELLEEMKHYTKSDFNERTTGVITRHFDLLTAGVIGWQMRDYSLAQNDSEDSSTCFGA